MNTSTHKPRIGLAVGGVAVGLVAALFLALAGVAIWGDVDKRDASGYVMTHSHRYATSTRAIATEEVTVGTEIPKWLIGKVRLEATSAKPVFVGIARKATVDGYLARTSYATATNLDLDPFSVTYVTHPGAASVGRPASQTFWAASAVGTTAELTWGLKSGSWSIVVMNADGSPGVSAEVTAGARLGWVLWAGIGAGIAGVLLAVLTVRMLAGAFRGPKEPTTAADPVPGI